MDFKLLKYYCIYKLSIRNTRLRYKNKYNARKNYIPKKLDNFQLCLDNINVNVTEVLSQNQSLAQAQAQAFTQDIPDMLARANQKVIDELKFYVDIKITHQKTFAPYENIHAGKDVVLVASGPSLNQFIPLPDAIYVGVNRSFLFEKINLDYLFMQDYIAVKDYIHRIEHYKNKNLKKFYGIMDVNRPEIDEKWIIPSLFTKRHNASRYYTKSVWFPETYEPELLTDDISNDKLICYGSIVFPALQFILYTRPRRLYLVGCDCEDNGQFNNPDDKSPDPEFTSVKYGWQMFKKFAEERYPHLEIVSVNPVGLKGLFTDMFQDKEKHES